MHHTGHYIRIAFFALLVAGFVLPAYGQVSMFADPKARSVGDILTIILAERTNAQRESGWENRSNARLSGSGSVEADDDLKDTFGFDAGINKEGLNRNESVQSDLLHGTMTVMVVGVDSTGNLAVQGERKLSVNGEAHVMKVSGLVRPFDIRYDNSILSYQIANANIEYRRAGFGRKWFKPGTLVRWGVYAILGAGAYYALGN